MDFVALPSLTCSVPSLALSGAPSLCQKQQRAFSDADRTAAGCGPKQAETTLKDGEREGVQRLTARKQRSSRGDDSHGGSGSGATRRSGTTSTATRNSRPLTRRPQREDISCSKSRCTIPSKREVISCTAFLLSVVVPSGCRNVRDRLHERCCCVVLCFACDVLWATVLSARDKNVEGR